MQWIKSHLSIVISGAIALISVGLLVFGMLQGQVSEAMQQDGSVLTSVQSIKPVNERLIQDAKRQQQENNARLQKVLAVLSQVGNHQPLVPEVFVVTTGDTSARRYQFRDRFKEKQTQLLEILRAKGIPTKEDVDRETELMDDQRQSAIKEETLGMQQPTPVKPGGLPGAVAPPIKPAIKPVLKPRDSMTLEERVQEDAAARISIRRARSIYCYAAVANLDPQPAMVDQSGRVPTIEDIWYAQMSLWIQEDILSALGRVNQRVADSLPETERWVGNLPVKQLGFIAIGNYVPAASAAGAGAAPMPRAAGRPNGPPPGDAGSVFTNRGSTNNVDVIQLTVDMVVAARMLPTILDELCKAGFYTPLLVTYDQVPPNLEMVGYIFGTQPVLHVNVQLEGCFLRSKYDKWMPETVKKEIAEGKSAMRVPTGGGGMPGGIERGGMGMPGRGGGRGFEEGP